MTDKSLSLHQRAQSQYLVCMDYEGTITTDTTLVSRPPIILQDIYLKTDAEAKFDNSSDVKK